MDRFRSASHRAHATALRSEMTMGEARLWRRLRAHRFFGLSFRQQAPAGPFIADFLCPSLRLIVELDGGAHDVSADARRDGLLRALGYRVFRGRNEDVMRNMDGVLEALKAECGL